MNNISLQLSGLAVSEIWVSWLVEVDCWLRTDYVFFFLIFWEFFLFSSSIDRD
jgi:hypothetical protein